MPIIKSAAKRVRQTITRTQRNTQDKRAMRRAIKDFLAAVAASDQKAATEGLKKAQSLIDKAVKRNILHKNTAARKKALLARKAKEAFAKAKAKPATKTSGKATAPKKGAGQAPAKKPAAKKAPAKDAKAPKKAPAKKAAPKKTAAKSAAKKATPKKK